MLRVTKETAQLLREFILDFIPNEPNEQYDHLDHFSNDLLAEFGEDRPVVVVPVLRGESHISLAEGEITVIGH